MKQNIKIAAALVAATLGALNSNAISLDDIQFWTGSGTNRAAMVIEWSSPEVLNYTTVPAPNADKTLVWGYRFNGVTTETEMFKAILAADPKLYAVADISWGFFTTGLGYNANGDGNIAITDGTTTNTFINGLLVNATVSTDAGHAVNSGDLYWGGYFGPNWEVWHELGGNGGFQSSPSRGSGQYWTPTDPSNVYDGGVHGQWELNVAGMGSTVVTNGSWMGLTVAGGGDNWMDESDPGTMAYEHHKHAPAAPEGYVSNASDFATEIVSSSGLSTATLYSDATSILGRPSLKFQNQFGGNAIHVVKMVEPPYNKAPDGTKVISQINSGGQVTVKMGRKVYDDPNNAYGVDLVVFGNSFFSASGAGTVGDTTDMGVATLSSGFYGHPTTVSVSQDGATWYSFTNTSSLYPQNAYRWDDFKHSWTIEQLNPTKPLNPSVYSMNFAGQPVTSGLDQFMGSAGGSGFDLKEAGLPWIQYVRVTPAGTGSSDYTVVDAIAAVNPTVVGDSLSITPANITAGFTNLVFVAPNNLSESLVSLSFNCVSEAAKINPTILYDLSPYAPLTSGAFTGYQFTVGPVTGTSVITYTNDLGLHAGSACAGADLLVYQWSGTHWVQPVFTYNTNSQMVCLSGVTNLSAFAISQLAPVKPHLKVVPAGVQLTYTPFTGQEYTVDRSTDLVHWTSISNVTAPSADPLTVSDAAQPATAVFYRVRFGH